MCDGSGIREFVHEPSGCRFETLQFIDGHLGAPIPQAGSNGQPHARMQNSAPGTFPWTKVLLMVKHCLIERDFQELTKGNAFIPRSSHQIFISQFIIHRGTQRSAKVAPQTHVPLPPKRCGHHRIFLPIVEDPIGALIQKKWKSLEAGVFPSSTGAETHVPAVANDMNKLCIGPKFMQNIEMPQVIRVFTPCEGFSTGAAEAIENRGDEVFVTNLRSIANHR